jgi:choline kinase
MIKCSMKAVMLAAGVGRRLGPTADGPKCLLEFGGKSLLARHIEILRSTNVRELVLGVGFEADRVKAHLARVAGDVTVHTVMNPAYEEGSVVTLWAMRDYLDSDLLLMDADVLYDDRIMHRLMQTKHANAFLLDRDFEQGDEPVKLCVRGGTFVEFRKKVEVPYDFCGESVGFFRFSKDIAKKLAAATNTYVQRSARMEPYEDAIRDVLLAEPHAFGFEDVTGLPWIEIDFPEDVARARDEILPRLLMGSDSNSDSASVTGSDSQPAARPARTKTST